MNDHQPRAPWRVGEVVTRGRIWASVVTADEQNGRVELDSGLTFPDELTEVPLLASLLEAGPGAIAFEVEIAEPTGAIGPPFASNPIRGYARRITPEALKVGSGAIHGRSGSSEPAWRDLQMASIEVEIPATAPGGYEVRLYRPFDLRRAFWNGFKVGDQVVDRSMSSLGLPTESDLYRILELDGRSSRVCVQLEGRTDAPKLWRHVSTLLRTDAGKRVTFTPPEPLPRYEQGIEAFRWRLQNTGKKA